jgi:hypothetical protein
VSPLPLVTDTPRPHRRVEARSPRVCEHCGADFTPRRSDARMCSNRCRHAHWRARRLHYALITWSPSRTGRLDARWTFHPSRAAALWVAPSDQPYTIVDGAIPLRPHPTIDEILATRFLQCP